MDGPPSSLDGLPLSPQQEWSPAAARPGSEKNPRQDGGAQVTECQLMPSATVPATERIPPICSLPWIREKKGSDWIPRGAVRAVPSARGRSGTGSSPRWNGLSRAVLSTEEEDEEELCRGERGRKSPDMTIVSSCLTRLTQAFPGPRSLPTG